MPSTPPADVRPVLDNPFAGFLDHPDLPLPGLLTAEDAQQTFAKHSVHFGSAHNSVFNPALTLWAWLSQVVFSDKSTAAACARVTVLLVALSRPPWSGDTGVYCRARSRLPAAPLQQMAEDLACRLAAVTPPGWLWHGRNVYLGDGTTVTAPDTEANQAAFPQPDSQKKGLGFPMIRLVVLITLATAVISAMAYGPYQGKATGETALLRRLLKHFKPGDVVVLDRYHGNFWMIALLRKHHVDVCIRVHHGKRCDFRKGKRLGKLDHVVTWQRPGRPEWLSAEEYQEFPKELTLREIAIDVPQRGGSGGRIIVATSLVDAKAYPKDDIAELYKWRWQVEVDLRHFKVALQLKHLSCKTPELLAAELGTAVLGYNLVRTLMAQAALYQRPCKRPSRLRRGAQGESPLTPRQISFKAALVQLREHFVTLSTATPEQVKALGEQILGTLARKRLQQRPGRQEPRAIKRRPPNRAMLTEPRTEVKERLAAGKTGKESGVNPRRRN
jgi:putative transposase